MAISSRYPYISPFQQPAEWREFNHILAATISTHAAKLNTAKSLAITIQEQLLATTDFMERLCAKTCTRCPDVCCLSAKIWADFKDALFWHLVGQAIPLEQNINHFQDTCHYLGKRGCTLPRLSRPFICTWYLCPTQVSRLKTSTRRESLKVLGETLQSIKQDRTMMENAFISSLL